MLPFGWSGVLLATALPATSTAAIVPADVLCHSTDQPDMVTLELPSNFVGISATLTRPVKGKGGFAVRVSFINEEDTEAVGFTASTMGIPPPRPGNPVPLFGYLDVGLIHTWAGGEEWATPPNGVPGMRYRAMAMADDLDLTLAFGGEDSASLSVGWKYEGEIENYRGTLQVDRKRFTKLAFACLNGDFALRNLTIRTR